MNKLNAVIIGMGKMGKIRYDNLTKHGGFSIVGVCDTNAENLKGHTHTFTNWRECLDKTECDVSIVCAVNSVIPEMVCEALGRGVHVFAEKPPGRNADDARRMRDAAIKSGKVLKFGFNHRYHNSVIEAKTLIVNRLLGEPLAARGVYGKAGSLQFPKEWRNNPNISGGGILLDQGIHMLDLLRYFLGDLSTNAASIQTLAWHDIKTEDSAFALLTTKNGLPASLHSSALQWKHKFDLDIMCENGYISLNGLNTSTQSYGIEKITYYHKDLEQKSGRVGNPVEHTLCFDTDESWTLEIDEFYNAVTQSKPLKNGTPDDAVKVMELIEEIYRLGK